MKTERKRWGRCNHCNGRGHVAVKLNVVGSAWKRITCQLCSGLGILSPTDLTKAQHSGVVNETVGY